MNSFVEHCLADEAAFYVNLMLMKSYVKSYFSMYKPKAIALAKFRLCLGANAYMNSIKMEFEVC